MERSDQSLAAKLIVYLGALAGVGYSIATFGDALHGMSISAVAWVAVLVFGLAFVVAAAVFVEHRSPGQ